MLNEDWYSSEYTKRLLKQLKEDREMMRDAFTVGIDWSCEYWKQVGMLQALDKFIEAIEAYKDL